ncbi:MAG: nucleotidyl transferase AbiEii/AbiGii toxin family protein [Lachnospiraceae bacterium]|nr:nucleotidyl transferase AbiEii/AbiGii toxin family protein [Lachnospiraceae bacterium]
MKRDELIKLVNETHNKSGIIQALIEKDFYITWILRELVKKNENVVFKGGTCLSKAYKIINRFSEDVDVTLKKEFASQSRIRAFNKEIEEVCYNIIGLSPHRKLQELHPIRHKGASNIYYLEYNSLYNESVNIKPFIELDSGFITKVSSVKKMKIQTMIQEILNASGEEIFESFEINVQPLEMIIADKFFAICKNFRRGNVNRYSRHFYDIYQSFTKEIKGKTENILRDYINETAKIEEEKYSPNENVEIRPLDEVLLECCNSKKYKDDYVNDLPFYLFDTKDMPSFEETSRLIKKIVKDGMFSGLNHYFINDRNKPNREQRTFIYEYIDRIVASVRNLTQEEFKRKYCDGDSKVAEEKISELKNKLSENGKTYDKTNYYIEAVEDISDTYLIIGRNINRGIVIDIMNEYLKR